MGLNDFGDKVKDATKNIEQGLNQLAKLDPLRIGHILDENTALRDRLQIATNKLASIQGSGVVNLPERNVIVRVVQFTGSFRVNGWIDREDNSFWKNQRLQNQNLTNLVNVGTVVEQSYMTHAPSSGSYDVWMPRVKHDAQAAVNNAFAEFLKKSAIIPGPEMGDINLNTRFGDPGVHAVNFKIIPVDADINGRWSIRIQIILQNQSGSTELVGALDLDSDLEQYKNWKMGEPLPIERMTVRVRTSS